MSLDPRQGRLAILSFAIGAFAIGTSEFAAMGLLPYYANDLGVTDPVAGHAISAYAIGVVIGAPVLAVMGAKLPRKSFLMMLMAGFVAAHVLGALAPNINALIAARFLAGLPHGAFLGVAMLTVADMMPKGKRAAGVAKVLLGLTIANVVGVPSAGALGQAIGWRSLFVIVALIALASVVMMGRFAPKVAVAEGASPLRELGALKNRAVWLTLLVGAVGFGGVFAVYSYLSAAMIDAANAPAWAIPLALSTFGIGCTLGNIYAGRLASWSQFGATLILLVGMIVSSVFYALVMGNWPLMALGIFVLGTTAGLVIPLQMRLMDVAGDAQTLAAALNHAAFNFANALGPFLAGIALSAGYGWSATGWVGAALSVGGIVVLAVAWAEANRKPRGPGVDPIPAE
ncbi:MAG: MFS transporter [Rhodobacteraceae bacterium]|nr:MFS transporter [Paracoccaceae bacterium]MAY44857.1 MFS transporter [Paracoccaceae bacterium]